jgi:hypothetical protein
MGYQAVLIRHRKTIKAANFGAWFFIQKCVVEARLAAAEKIVGIFFH